jgi:hypothetical protein
MVGWRIVSGSSGKTTAAFVLHLGNVSTSFDAAATLGLPRGGGYNYTVLYPETLIDMITPLLPVSKLGRAVASNVAGSASLLSPASSKAIKLPPYSVLTLSVAADGAN